MELNEILKKYCDQATLNSAGRLVRENMITKITADRQSDGGLKLTGRARDDFNFVNHPTVTVDNSGAVTGYACDCVRGRKGTAMCVHCAALALAADADTAPEPEKVPDSVDFPTAAPTYAPQPEPIPQSAPESEPQSEPEPISYSVEEPETEETEEPWYDQEPEAEPEPEEAVDPRTMEILFGNLLDNGEPVWWRPNDTEQVFHTNTGIIGTMGTGKTQFTKSLVTQLYRQRGNNFANLPISILIFDYKGDYNETKADFVAATDAKVLKPYRLPYNPLALISARTFKPLLPVHTANAFKDTLSKIYKLGPKQQQALFDCILAAYEQFGISQGDPSTWTRTAPTFEQVYKIFAADETRAPDTLTACMNKLHQFCIFEDRPASAKPMNQVLNGVVVIDLSGYDDDIQSLIVAITLDQFYSQMHANGSSKTDGKFRQLRNLILVDEADSFMSKDFPSLKKIMKEGREFGVGVILSTQSLAHFISDNDDYSRYVLTWIVHNVSDLKQRDVEYVFKLQPKSPDIERYYSEIKGLFKHESVVKLSNDKPVRIKDRAFWQLISEGQK